MGGANNRSLISAHFCISAYFLTAETYKRMRLTTRVYGIMFVCMYKLNNSSNIMFVCMYKLKNSSNMFVCMYTIC